MRPRESVHDIGRMRVVAECRPARDVIGMCVRVDDIRKLPALFLQQAHVIVNAFEDRIDNSRLTGLFARDEICATRARIELFKNHGFLVRN